MGDVIDLDAYRRKVAESTPERPRRRRTPGGRGFDEDITRHLSVGLPSPRPEDGDAKDET